MGKATVEVTRLVVAAVAATLVAEYHLAVGVVTPSAWWPFFCKVGVVTPAALCARRKTWSLTWHTHPFFLGPPGGPHTRTGAYIFFCHGWRHGGARRPKGLKEAVADMEHDYMV